MIYTCSFSIRRIYTILKSFGIITSIWPFYLNNKCFDIYLKVLYYFILLNYLCVLIPLVAMTIFHVDTSATITITAVEQTIMTEAVFNLLYSKFYREKFKVVVKEIETFLKECTCNETRVLDQYVSARIFINIYLAIIYSVAIMSFNFGQVFLEDRPYPLDLWYPFSIESQIVVVLIYVNQVIVITHTIILIVFDAVAQIFLWILAARFGLLQRDFELTASETELKNNVKKHQYLIRLTQSLIDFTKYMILKVFLAVTIITTFSTLQILYRGPSTIIIQFFFVMKIAFTRALTYCWAGHNLQEKTEALSLSMYHSDWINQSHSTKTNVLIIMQRCQKPLVVRVKGIISSLSFGFYVNYLYMIYSAFMTLRAVLKV